jgi:hypothetical protein
MIMFFKNGDITPNIQRYATEEDCNSVAHQIVAVANQDDNIQDVLWSCVINPVEAIKKGSI